MITFKFFYGIEGASLLGVNPSNAILLSEAIRTIERSSLQPLTS